MSQFFPTTPSPEPVPGRSASPARPQGEGSFSPDAPEHNAIAGLRSVAIVHLLFTATGVGFGLLVVVALRHPAAAIGIIGLALSAGAIVGGVLFAAHRGDGPMGIADTQGRDADL